jgi:hypothetical protein
MKHKEQGRNQQTANIMQKSSTCILVRRNKVKVRSPKRKWDEQEVALTSWQDETECEIGLVLIL